MDHLILSKNKKEKESQHLNHQLSRQTDNSWRINKTNFKPKGDNNQYGKIGDKICTSFDGNYNACLLYKCT